MLVIGLTICEQPQQSYEASRLQIFILLHGKKKKRTYSLTDCVSAAIFNQMFLRSVIRDDFYSLFIGLGSFCLLTKQNKLHSVLPAKFRC